MEVLRAAQKVGKAAGKHCGSGAEVTMRIAQGFQFLALSNDSRLMAKAATEEFNAIDFSGGSTSAKSEDKGDLY